MSKHFFNGIRPIEYEGPQSRNPMAFHYYDKNLIVRGKSLKDHLRFAVAYWHSFGGGGDDPFGRATRSFPWNEISDPLQKARVKMDAAFEFMRLTGIEFYCFHDYDLVDEADTLTESQARLESIIKYAAEKQKEYNKQLLWGTANLFSHPRYMNGAITNPDFRVVTYAASQVKNAIDATVLLKGQNYVFWGGREGYLSLLNTDMKRELDHLGVFLSKAKDYGRKNGFTGTFLIEPKPMEPTKHHYDYDAATVIGFLKEYGLEQDFKLNIEVNHATLSGHTFQHELQTAANHGLLGSIDANRGDYQNGWDTDQFPINIYELTEAFIVLLRSGGLKTGGINFDAKLRRNSTDVEDLFIAHIAGMDAFARALIIADEILEHSELENLRSNRYASFDAGEGEKFENGKLDLETMHRIAIDLGEPEVVSAKQEYYEMILNQYL